MDGDKPRYDAFWAHDYAGERRAFEDFIDFVHARLARYPDLHVYHFGAYEQSAIKQLMGEYATREFEVDDLLRRKIFVNLYSIFRQALRAGVSSYSLKKLEPLFEFKRVADVKSGMEAIVDYEHWRESQDNKFLDQIAAYNEEDCRATLALLDWLHEMRPSRAILARAAAAACRFQKKHQRRSMRANACASSLCKAASPEITAGLRASSWNTTAARHGRHGGGISNDWDDARRTSRRLGIDRLS